MAVEDSAGGARSSNPQATETAPPDKDDSKETEASALVRNDADLGLLSLPCILLRSKDEEAEHFATNNSTAGGSEPL